MDDLQRPRARPRSQHAEAVFLDRDGVINANRVDHVKRWSEFDFLPGAGDAIRRLTAGGWRVFVISNQAIVGRGIVRRAEVDEINAAMVAALDRQGAHIEGVAYCPHAPHDQCMCRKPRPGLLLRLARDHGLDLNASVVVGDALSDIQAGQSVGCRTMLVLTGRGPEQLQHARVSGINGFTVADDLRAAADLLLNKDARPEGAAAEKEQS